MKSDLQIICVGVSLSSLSDYWLSNITLSNKVAQVTTSVAPAETWITIRSPAPIRTDDNTAWVFQVLFVNDLSASILSFVVLVAAIDRLISRI